MKDEEDLNEEKYSQFIKSIMIEDIFLKKIEANRFLSLYSNQEDEKNDKGVDFELMNIEFSKNKNNLKYSLIIVVKGFDKNDSSKENFNIRACLEVLYSLENQMETSKEILNIFSKNVIFNAWPYIRELINDITNKMGIVVPPLPLLKNPNVVRTAEG